MHKRIVHNPIIQLTLFTLMLIVFVIAVSA